MLQAERVSKTALRMLSRNGHIFLLSREKTPPESQVPPGGLSSNLSNPVSNIHAYALNVFFGQNAPMHYHIPRCLKCL